VSIVSPSETILDFIRPGDALVVTKLHRLGRSTRDSDYPFLEPCGSSASVMSLGQMMPT
jgi:hypothetical protein